MNTIVITAEIESGFVAKDDLVPFRCSPVSSCGAPHLTEASMGGCQGKRTLRPTRVPLLDARFWAAGLAWAREHRDWSVDDRKRVAWSDESRFRLLNAEWRQTHGVTDPACQKLVESMPRRGQPLSRPEEARLVSK
ncbi:hypothetical protein TNCV_3307991 [Trichonephila clavipes]|nr:hypothetical protein TNCV_3307991 [Trichonephila clavipes]